MATTYHDLHRHSDDPQAPIEVKQVDSDQALVWIEAGWRDFINAPGHSLLYGVLFSLFCIGTIYLTQEYPGFVLSFLTGLMLVGPLLAVGAFTASWQMDRGYSVSIREGLALVRSRATNLSLFAAMLLVVLMAWIRSNLISTCVFLITPSRMKMEPLATRKPKNQ